ncbi:MAG TPA: glycosyltransferase family 39 protein [Aromatoleum sp.]|uniref:glycosyltransferase family 39 protein n=1 Tax=Aromatoleum sp. TaxID=2307007 RepID=UPI002B485117|nr:glycosyltransferase family 39 protein [Aromatoleum sp.]HJV27391.1 glycosyltransferase family 39 protein [Aromatoleum sp.]
MVNRLPWPLKGSPSPEMSIDTAPQTHANTPRNLASYNKLAPAITINVLIALGIRLWHLDHLSIWLDEAHTAIDSTLSPKDLWLSALTDKPPLYYLITSIFWSPGENEFSLRLPAAVIGALSVAASGYLGRAIAGLKGAVTLSLFFAVSMVNVRYSQEARQYILLALGWILVVSALYLFATRPAGNRTERKLRLGAFSVGCLVMLHTHLIAVVYILLGLFSCFFVLLVTRRLTVAIIVRLGLCFLVCFATLVPWLAAVTFKYSAGKDSFDWLVNPGAAEAVSIYLRDAVGGRLTFALSVAGLVIYGLRKDLATSLFFLILAIVPPISIWILGHAKPVYMGRIVMLSHVPILAGLLLLACMPERRWVYGLTVALISAVLVPPTARYFRDFVKEDWRGVASQIALAQDERAPVFIERISFYKPFMFYLPGNTPDVYLITDNSAGEMIAVDANAGWMSKCLAFSCDALTMKIAGAPEAAWYVTRGAEPTEAAVFAFNWKLNHLTGNEYVLSKKWVGYGLLLFKFQKKEAVLPG